MAYSILKRVRPLQTKLVPGVVWGNSIYMEKTGALFRAPNVVTQAQSQYKTGFISYDNGLTWDEKKCNFPLSFVYESTCAFGHDLYVSTMSRTGGTPKVYASKDQGMHWSSSALTETDKTGNQRTGARSCKNHVQHAVVALPDGSLLCTGGPCAALPGITYRTVDGGRIWETLQPGIPRALTGHAMAVLPDHSVLLTGGLKETYGSTRATNNVLRSFDYGSTWHTIAYIEHDRRWAARYGHNMIVSTRTGAIFLMNGQNEKQEFFNDMWVSFDSGYTWDFVGEMPWLPRSRASAYMTNKGRQEEIRLLGGHYETAVDMFGMHDVWVLNLASTTSDRIKQPKKQDKTPLVT